MLQFALGNQWLKVAALVARKGWRLPLLLLVRLGLGLLVGVPSRSTSTSAGPANSYQRIPGEHAQQLRRRRAPNRQSPAW